MLYRLDRPQNTDSALRTALVAAWCPELMRVSYSVETLIYRMKEELPQWWGIASGLGNQARSAYSWPTVEILLLGSKT